MLGQPRTTQRRARKVASDEGALRGDIVRLASRFGRYGYRRVTDMLRIEGWGVNHKRVERIWRHTRECLAIVVARKIRSHDVLEVLADLFVRHGPPEYLRSDRSSPELCVKVRGSSSMLRLGCLGDLLGLEE